MTKVYVHLSYPHAPY